MIPLENGCTWQCVKDDKEYNISIIGKDEKTAELKTTKKGLFGAKERKITDYCVKTLHLMKLIRLLRKH
jgi:hypothetical protein